MENPQRESETKEGLHMAIDRAHGEREPFNPWDRRKDVGVKYANVYATINIYYNITIRYYNVRQKSVSLFPELLLIMKCT